jgi:hypothetical protein
MDDRDGACRSQRCHTGGRLSHCRRVLEELAAQLQ